MLIAGIVLVVLGIIVFALGFIFDLVELGVTLGIVLVAVGIVVSYSYNEQYDYSYKTAPNTEWIEFDGECYIDDHKLMCENDETKFQVWEYKEE